MMRLKMNLTSFNSWKSIRVTKIKLKKTKDGSEEQVVINAEEDIEP